MKNSVLAIAILTLAAGAALAQEPPYVHPLHRPANELGRPAPVVVFTGHETFLRGDRPFVRYRLAVTNHRAWRRELFAPAPALPPCTNVMAASRTWVDIYQVPRGRLHGFCEMTRPDELGQLWFALPAGTAPPAQVVVLIWDRQTATYYRSLPLNIPAPPR